MVIRGGSDGPAPITVMKAAAAASIRGPRWVIGGMEPELSQTPTQR